MCYHENRLIWGKLMLVNTFGKKISAALVVKNSQFYIEVAKFVQAYNLILSRPNDFLREIGESEINASVQKLSWKSLTTIMQKCDFGFAEVPAVSDLLVFYNYAIEMGSIDKNEKMFATVDDIADAQKNYYNFVDDATEKAKAEYLKNKRVFDLREKEAVEVDKKLSSLTTQKWMAIVLSIFAVAVFCVGVWGLVFGNFLVDAIGGLVPVWEKRYLGSAVVILLSVLMFYFCEKWQIKSMQEHKKLNHASQTIFSHSNSTFVAQSVAKRKFDVLKRDLDVIKQEINDENKTYDVKANIDRLLQTNEYYKKFVTSLAESLSQESKSSQMSFGDDNLLAQDLTEEREHEIIMEGQFDEQAYNEKFEKSTKKEKKPAVSPALDDEIDAKLIQERLQKQLEESKQMQNQTAPEKDENLDQYIDYIKEVLGQDLEEEMFQNER